MTSNIWSSAIDLSSLFQSMHTKQYKLLTLLTLLTNDHVDMVYTFDAVDTVYIVDTSYTVYTIVNALQCLSISKYAYVLGE